MLAGVAPSFVPLYVIAVVAVGAQLGAAVAALGRTSAVLASAELADDAVACLRRLDALAEDVFGGAWSGVAASAYAREWHVWRGGAQAVLAALTEMSTGLRQAAAEDAAEEWASTSGFERLAS